MGVIDKKGAGLSIQSTRPFSLVSAFHAQPPPPLPLLTETSFALSCSRHSVGQFRLSCVTSLQPPRFLVVEVTGEEDRENRPASEPREEDCERRGEGY